MTESHRTPAPIGDELLSAYIDGQLNAAEHQRVEKALATDGQVQERFETLQMTVNLMQNAPPVRVPRAFALSEAQVLAAGGKVKGIEQPGFFGRLFPRMMPLATAAVALLLVVLVSVDLWPGFVGGAVAPQPAVQQMESAAAPAQDEAVAEEAPPMEIPAEEAVEAEVADMALEVESTVLVEEEAVTTVVVEELAKREEVNPAVREKAFAEDSAAGEALSARATAGQNLVQSTPMPLSTSDVAEAPMAAAPPPEPLAGEAEPALEVVDESPESIAEVETEKAEHTFELIVAENIAHAPSRVGYDGKPTWLRPVEFILALLFVCLLVATLVLRMRTRADAS